MTVIVSFTVLTFALETPLTWVRGLDDVMQPRELLTENLLLPLPESLSVIKDPFSQPLILLEYFLSLFGGLFPISLPTILLNTTKQMRP